MDCVVKLGSFKPMPVDMAVVCPLNADQIDQFVESMAGAVEMANYISVADLQVRTVNLFVSIGD